jgi:hypothetical protein
MSGLQKTKFSGHDRTLTYPGSISNPTNIDVNITINIVELLFVDYEIIPPTSVISSKSVQIYSMLFLVPLKEI